ncbi:MAG: GNAT family N-acetyltransferase [Bacteroidota bacterium]
MAPASPAFKISEFAISDAGDGVAMGNEEGIARWQAIQAISTQNTPFSSLPFARALARHCNKKATLWLVADNTRDLASLVTFHRKQGPFLRVEVPPFTPFTSVLCAQPEVANDALASLANHLADKFDDIRLHLHPGMQDIRSFKWANWQTGPFYTYELDLSTYDVSQQGWSTGTRRNFKKNKDLYKINRSASDLEQIVALCAAGYNRNKRQFPLAQTQLLNLAGDLLTQNMVRCFTAVDATKGTIEAGVAVLHDGTKGYYWIAGSNPGPAMTVLLGNMLPALQAEGIQTFDFVGANTPGIAEFKRRFGAILTPYFAVTHTPNPLLATMLRIKRLLSA